MGCIFSFFKFNQSYKVAEPSENKDSTQHQGKKASKKQQSGQQSNKSGVKNEHPPPNQSFIYKTVLETTVADPNVIEEEERKKAEEAPGPFEIETDLLSPEVEEAVIKIQANVRGYLTRKQYRATPERSIEKPLSQVNQEPVESANDASSGILAPPPSFSDTPKELPLDEDNQTANQGKKIAEKLIELEKQVSQANEPHDKKPAVDIGTDSRQLDDKKVNNSNTEQSITVKSNESTDVGGNSNNLKLLEIPSIETDFSESPAPGEAATKIQAAFRGYQVRKTISRETSPAPLKSKDKMNDKSSELDDFGDDDGKVNLRERVSNAAQDPERESILVLDQLEEALSKELLKTSGKTGDETSSSNSTDIDLNSSMKSNSSLIPSTQVESDSIQKVTSDNLPESLSNSNDSKDTLIDNSSLSDDKSLTSNNDNLSSTNAENTVCTQSSKSKQVNEPVSNTVASDLKESDILDTSSNGNNFDEISEEPVMFVSNEDKVDASSKSESEEVKQETDAVVIVEVAGKLNASPLLESTSNSKIDLNENIHVNSNISHESQLDSNENNQPKNEPKLDSPISMETEEVLNQLVTQSEETTDSKVDQIPTCDKSNILSKKDIDSLPQLITSNKPSSVQESEEIQIKPEFPSPKSTDDPSDSSNVIVKEKSSQTMESKILEKADDIKADESVTLENKESQNELQKNQKLLKEDSFGSDILILDDDSVDRSDTLYDIIAEKGLNVSQSSSQQHAPIFDNNSREEEKDNNLLLYDQSVDPNVFSFNTDASESITEMKDDILVNLDESDDEEEKKNIEPTVSTKSTVGNDNLSSTMTIATNENDQLNNEKSNASISNDSVSSHLLVEECSILTLASVTNDQISKSAKSTEISSETHVKLSENFKESFDKDLNREQLENDDIATNETIIKPINDSLDEQIGSSNTESCIKEFSLSSDDQLGKSDKISAVLPDENLKDHVSQENALSQEVFSVDQMSPDTDLIPKMKPLEFDEKISRDLLIESNEITKTELTVTGSSPPKVGVIINESEECSNKTEFIDQKSIPQTPVTINVQPTITTAEAVQDKPDENSNAAKDVKDNLITQGKTSPVDSLEAPQSQSETVQDDSSVLKQTKISVSNLQFESSTGSNLDESTCSSQSVLVINQPEIVEISAASEPPNSSTESTPNEESDDKTEDSNPEDENRLLRIVDRDARSKSPNPFGRKRRKGKKGRGVQ